jgi:hypothetical protein
MCRQLEMSTKFFADFRVQLDRTRRVTSKNDVLNVLQQYFLRQNS